MLRVVLSFILGAAVAVPAMAYPLSPEDAASMMRQNDVENVDLYEVNETVSVVDGHRNGYNFSARMMGCGEDERCDSVMLFATFSMDGYLTTDQFERINLYNDNLPFGRAFILGELGEYGYSVGVDYVIDIANEHNFNAPDLDKFFLVIESFVSHMTEDQDQEQE